MKKKNKNNDENILRRDDIVGAEQFNDYNAPLPDSVRRKKRRKGSQRELPQDTRMPEMAEAERRLQLQRQHQNELEYVRQQELAREQQVREQKRLQALREQQERQMQQTRSDEEDEDEKLRAGRITVSAVEQQPEEEQDEYLYQEYDDEPSFKYLNLKDGKISETDEDAADIQGDDEDSDDEGMDSARAIRQKITPEGATVTDIREERKKRRNLKHVKRLVIIGIIAAIGLGIYISSKYWIPKLEGILDEPHETIVNDGKAEGGNFPLKVAQSNITSITGWFSTSQAASS